MTILRITEKAMMRAICGVKLIEKRSQELMSLPDLKDTLNGLARLSGVQWHRHILRKDREEHRILKWQEEGMGNQI